MWHIRLDSFNYLGSSSAKEAGMLTLFIYAEENLEHKVMKLVEFSFVLNEKSCFF